MTNPAPDGPDVFLSYAREDEARARELATALGQHGLSVFWDREIPPGQTWPSYIGKALAHARCIVVGWSRHSIASQWVLEEASEGRDRKVLVPVLFEAVQPPFGFGGIQAAKLIDWRPGQTSPAFDSLLRAVQRIVAEQAGSGIEPEAEVAAPLQPEPSEPATKTKPRVRTSGSTPVGSEPRAATVRHPDGRAIAWSRRTVAAMIGGLVALAGAWGIIWQLTQPGPDTPEPGTEAAVEPSTPPAAPRETAKPVGEAEPTTPEPESPDRAAATEPAVEPAPPPAAPRETAEPGDEMRDCPECPEMVLVPAGEFTMGSPPDEPGREDDEAPPRKVTIAMPFWVSKHEVTFAEWDVCVAGGECKQADDRGWGRDSRPVITRSWNDAKAYVFWLSQKTGKTYRLLSEAEWEYAARAGSTTAFWWGPGVGSDNANCNGCGGGWGGRVSAPVGSFKANAFGLYDTAGNVWEWVEDCYHDNYQGAPTDGAPRLDGECTDRVLRGGAWNDEPKVVRSASRDRGTPDTEWRSDIGFRVKRAAD